jgi:hypothetical protein
MTLDLGSEPARWVLLTGWESQPTRGRSEVWMVEPTASLVVPVLVPRELRVSLTLSATGDVTLQAALGKYPLGAVRVGMTPAVTTFLVPASALVRGENVLALQARPLAPVRLHQVRFEPGS